MARIEAENGYLKINLAPGETFAKAQDDAGNTEITFDSAKDAEAAMDILAEVQSAVGDIYAEDAGLNSPKYEKLNKRCKKILAQDIVMN